jgi:hypothetical protein
MHLYLLLAVFNGSILPALLDRFPHPLCVFLFIVLVEIGGFDIGGGARVGVIEQTAGLD